MTWDATDWTITRSNGNIRYIGDAHAGSAPTYATGIELHRALQDFADQEVDSGDDELSIIDEVPSQRGGVDTNITLLNGFNIDQTAAEHLYDTSITQEGGDDIYDGIQVFGNSASIQVIQNGARITNDFWNEAKMIAAVEDAASSTTHRFLVLVRSAGADIDGRRLIGTQRVYGTQYTEFSIGGGTNRGNNVLALKADSNLNNQTLEATIGAIADITNIEGYQGIDADGNTTDEFYYSDWELGANSKNDFYEYAQWLQREGTVSTLYGLSADIFRGITHSITVDTPTGTLVEPESLSWGTGATAGTGQLLATNSTTAATEIWIQLLTGVLPTDGMTITGNGGGTVDVNVTVSAKTISLPFIGASTGSAIIGAYGLGIGADDLAVADLVIDLTGTANQPPNNVTFTVTGLVANEDYVLVGPELAGVLDVAQLGLNATLTGAAVTSIVSDTVIPVDTPASGSIRVQTDSGKYIRIDYSSYTGSTFTITSTDFSSDNATAGNNMFVSYIDEEITSGTTLNFTTVFNASRTLVVRRRYGGEPSPTVPYEATATLGSGGGSAAVARVSDE